ncbi:MAG: hypothetical protein H3Z53_08615 [archaeon]|nr:hypothetical protein [archaeon]MCP8314414.1 hypothetical protein [archaeon]MCP8319380.1 hypothetical protein [archaeon]
MTEDKKNLGHIKEFYMVDPYRKSLAKKILGYFVIPVWLLGFVITTLVFIALLIVAPIKKRLSKRKAEPYFRVRSIFPEE